MSATPLHVPSPADHGLVVPTAWSGATCTCGGTGAGAATTTLRGQRLVRLDRAVAAGQVTVAEASERRVELLAR